MNNPETNSVIKLNLGCGNSRILGYTGVDLYPCQGRDITHDLNQPLPFPDSSVSAVIAHHIIEHVADPMKFLEDIHRVCRNDAEVEIITPHFASATSYIDITHKWHLSYFSLDPFCQEQGCHYRTKKFKRLTQKLSFSGHPLGFIGRMIALFSMKEYEYRWSYMFRPSNLHWKLSVVK